VVASPTVADLYVMLGQNGSMADAFSTGTKWSAATSALATFTSAPPAGLSLGLQSDGVPPQMMTCPSICFTDADCGPVQNWPCLFGTCTGCVGTDSCTSSDYATPEFEISPMPAGKTAIATSLSLHSPSTSNPTSAALQGLVDHSIAWAIAHPAHRVGAVLFLSGDPTECDTSTATLQATASSALNGLPSIATNVIVMGAGDAVAQSIATSGGTTLHTTNDAAGITAALTSIATGLTACTFAVPPSSIGTADGGALTVVLQGISIPQVANAAACAGRGWWYLGHDVIGLCPASCAANADAGVTVQLGCPSQH
jgi:hypothetical protein